jgi:hypothetical protein
LRRRGQSLPRDQNASAIGMILVWRHRAFIAFLIVYGALLAFQFNHGVASGDAHGIIRAVQTLIDTGKVQVSRPPGHPTTEIYLFGFVAWILRNLVSADFTYVTYAVCQAVGALATLVVFYELLLRLGADRTRALLATICGAFSAQFFLNAVDGEEFVFGVFFVILSVRFLVAAGESPRFSKLLLSIFSFALATGCRPELVFAAIIFPIYCLFNPKLGWSYAVSTVAVAAVAVTIVWLPIVFVGIRQPYTAGMNFRESILGGLYRIVFQAFTLPVFVLLLWVLLSGLIHLRGQIESRNFIFTVSCALPLIFFATLFLHASKAAHLLVALPFLLILAAARSILFLLALTFLTLLGSVVTIDIFKDRQLVRPFMTDGTYFQAVYQKPYYRLSYLRAVTDQCGAGPSLIIANAWPWDFEYHIERGNLPLQEKNLQGQIKQDVRAFFSSGEHCIYLPPDAAYENALLKEWQRNGYAMKMDAKLYRILFARYDVRSRLSSAREEVSGVPFSLFRVD